MWSQYRQPTQGICIVFSYCSFFFKPKDMAANCALVNGVNGHGSDFKAEYNHVNGKVNGNYNYVRIFNFNVIKESKHTT